MCSDASPLISVIVPAFNAASTLTDAVESALGQENFTDYEIIIINDGSMDATGHLARQLEARSPGRVRVIDLPQNSGSAVAWQTGVDASRGRYVTKLDADDTLAPGALAALAAGAKGGAKVVRGQFNRIVDDDGTPFGPDANRVKLNDMPICVDYFSLCGKIIDRRLLADAGIRAFPGLDCWEDLGVVARVTALEPATITIPDVVYNYWIAPKGLSLSTSERDKLLSHHIAVAREVEKWLDARNLSRENAEFLLHLKFAAKVKFLRGRHRRVQQWKTTFPEVNKKVMGLRHVAMPHRILFAAVALLPSWLSQSVANIIDR